MNSYGYCAIYESVLMNTVFVYDTYNRVFAKNIHLHVYVRMYCCTTIVASAIIKTQKNFSKIDKNERRHTQAAASSSFSLFMFLTFKFKSPTIAFISLSPSISQTFGDFDGFRVVADGVEDEVDGLKM